MAESIVVEKAVGLEIDIQIDYVKCRECSQELGFDLQADSYGDLQITADKCDCEN